MAGESKTQLAVRKAREEMRERFEQQGIVATDTDSDEVMARIATAIGEAETADDILGGGKTIPVKDNPEILGRRLTVIAWEGRYSSTIVQRDGSAAPFAVIFAVDPESKEEMVLSCGGEIVLAQLTRLSEKKLLPREVKFVEAGRALRMTLPDVQTFEGEAVEDGELVEG